MGSGQSSYNIPVGIEIGYGSVRDVDSLRFPLRMNIHNKTAFFTDANKVVHTVRLSYEQLNVLNNGKKIWITLRKYPETEDNPTFTILD